MAGPLSGVRVVEATFFQNGPFAGVMLADLGADIIKIEPPVTGDPGRGLGIPGAIPGTSTYFQAQNRSKRGITLDLQKPEGREVAYRLIDTADIFIDGNRPGVCNKLGVGPDGRVLARAPQGEDSILYAEIDFAENAASHARQLFLRHRRPELYAGWLSG